MKTILVALVFVAVGLLVHQNMDMRKQLAKYENYMHSSSSELDNLRARYARGRDKYKQLQQEYQHVARENSKLRHMVHRSEKDDSDDPDYKKVAESKGFRKRSANKRGEVRVTGHRPIYVD